MRLLVWTADVRLRDHLLDKGELPEHGRRLKLYQHLSTTFDLANLPMLYLEFGVAEGDSVRWWSSQNVHPDSRFIGHDSFEGLPEAWAMMPRGGFSTRGVVPIVNDGRVTFVKGWFKDTVGRSLLIPRPSPDHRLVANLDADLYGSTAVCLHALYPLLKEGDLLLFDEFAYPLDEFRSFEDFKDAFGIQLQLVAAVNCGDVSAFEVKLG